MTPRRARRDRPRCLRFEATSPSSPSYRPSPSVSSWLHTSGLPAANADGRLRTTGRAETDAAYRRSVTLKTKPGERFVYFDVGFGARRDRPARRAARRSRRSSPPRKSSTPLGDERRRAILPPTRCAARARRRLTEVRDGAHDSGRGARSARVARSGASPGTPGCSRRRDDLGATSHERCVSRGALEGHRILAEKTFAALHHDGKTRRTARTRARLGRRQHVSPRTKGTLLLVACLRTRRLHRDGDVDRSRAGPIRRSS